MRACHVDIASPGSGQPTPAAWHRTDPWPALAAVALLAAALFNYGIALPGATLRLTECAAALLCLVALASWRRDDPGRIALAAVPPWFWLAPVGYLAWSALSAFEGGGLGQIRFEVQALAVGLAGLVWADRIRGGVFIGAVAVAVLAETGMAVALAASGWRAIHFFAADGPWLWLTFDEGANPDGGWLQLGGTLGHKSALAAFYTLALPVCAVALARPAQSPVWRIAQGAAVGAGLVGLALTQSRFGLATAMAALGLVALTALARWTPRRGRLIMGVFFVISIAALALALLAAGPISHQLEAAQTGSVAGRAYLWRESLALMAERPWIGIGRDGFEDAVAGGFSHAHNLYLMKGIESGAPGALLFLIPLAAVAGACLRALWRAASAPGATALPLRTGFAAGVLGFCLFSGLDYFYNEPPLMALFWLWAAMAVGPGAAAASRHREAGP